MGSLASFNSLKSLYNQKVGKLQALEQQLANCNARLSTLSADEDTVSKASLFLQSLSDTARIQVIEKISGLVTEVLQAVKDPNLEFKMVLGNERGQPDLKFFVLDKLTGTEFSALDSMGGGICDIIAFTLRLALLTKWQPSLAKIIIADESFKHVSVKDQEPLAEFIKLLCDKLNLQMILITHSNVISTVASKTFEVTKGSNGISKVEERTSL